MGNGRSIAIQVSEARGDAEAEALTAEELQVLRWRFEQLVGHGYGHEVAAELAGDHTVELALARRLVSELGCPHDLAVRILR